MTNPNAFGLGLAPTKATIFGRKIASRLRMDMRLTDAYFFRGQVSTNFAELVFNCPPTPAPSGFGTASR